MGEEEKKEVEAPEKKEEPAPPLKGDKKDVVEGNDEESKKKKAEDGVGGEGEKTDPPPPPPPPPEELIMRVYMHCEGCARKVQRSLKGFIGVENVTTDCRTHKVVVKGKVAAADPLNVVERVRKKTGRKVELLTPIPPKPEKEEKEEEKPKPVEEVKEEPKVIAVVLKAHMHCEACSLEIKKRILKMKGVQSVVAELKSSQVTVKGFIEPGKLVEYIYKRTGKHAFVVKVEPEEKDKDESGKDEKKTEGDDVNKEGAEDEGEKGNKTGGAAGNAEGEGMDEKDVVTDESMAAAMAAKIVELKKNEYYYFYPKYAVEYAYEQPYPQQFFSDENPNACSVM